MCDRTGKFVLLRQSCGPARAVPVDCGDPLCEYCEKRRAREIMARWSPVVEAMRYPVMLTPTIKNGGDLRDRIKFYQESFRRLLDLRLGARNRPKFLREARWFIRGHIDKLLAAGEITKAEAEYRVLDWEKSLVKFDKRLAGMVTEKTIKRKNKKGEIKEVKVRVLPRLRDVIGYGVAMFEITINELKTWHPHRHIILDTFFLPWPYLVVLWKVATRGEGEVIDIRPVGKSQKDMREIFKYLTKSWEIPEDKKDELRDAVRGLKRVWPLGGAKPVEVEEPCPFCGELTCRPHLVAMGEHATRQKVAGLDVLRIVTSDAAGSLDRWFYLDKGTWREAAPEVVDLILREFACHSSPSPPPQMVLTGTGTW
jgi:hypothetical protein